jgi:hypothetical protein
MASANDEDASVRTTVTIPKNDYEVMEKIAREKRVSVAWVVREALAEYLAQSPSQGTKAITKKAGKK